jgi:hypothetical protein
MMTGTTPGSELAAFGGALAGGLLLVFLFFWLCVKVGVKPTVSVFTAGLWPQRARRRRQKAQREGAAGEHRDETPPPA